VNTVNPQTNLISMDFVEMDLYSVKVTLIVFLLNVLHR